MCSPRKLRGCIITSRHHPSLRVESLAAGAGLQHEGNSLKKVKQAFRGWGGVLLNTSRNTLRVGALHQSGNFMNIYILFVEPSVLSSPHFLGCWHQTDTLQPGDRRVTLGRMRSSRDKTLTVTWGLLPNRSSISETPSWQVHLYAESHTFLLDGARWSTITPSYKDRGQNKPEHNLEVQQLYRKN